MSNYLTITERTIFIINEFNDGRTIFIINKFNDGRTIFKSRDKGFYANLINHIIFIAKLSLSKLYSFIHNSYFETAAGILKSFKISFGTDRLPETVPLKCPRGITLWLDGESCCCGTG